MIAPTVELTRAARKALGMRALLIACACAVALLACTRPCSAQEAPTNRQIVLGYNLGFRVSVSPGVIIPPRGERLGFALGGDIRYGFGVGPFVLAPGLRPSAYFLEHQNIVAMPVTLRVTAPIGFLGPYVVGGAGPGFVSRPKEFGVAVMGGGGLMVHIGMHFGIGAEATYHVITGTSFRALFVGPSILIAF